MTIKIGTKVECQDGEQGIVTHIIQNDELTYHIKMDNGSIRKLWTHDLIAVDQPQPADETTIEGDVSFYADGKPQDGVIVAGTDRYGYTVKSVDGKVYDEIKRGDIEPRLADEIDNLPFSDVGKEDTQEAPAVIVDTTPTLSNIIDAALDPDNQAAYEALKVYDFASTPLWALKIERDDVNAYKWQIWHELRKMPYGVMGSNPDYAAKQLEVDRAFNVMAILNDAIYSYHKGVGFNVLD